MVHVEKILTKKEKLVLQLAKNQTYIKRWEIDMIYSGKQNADKAIKRLCFFGLLVPDSENSERPSEKRVYFHNLHVDVREQQTLQIGEGDDGI